MGRPVRLTCRRRLRRRCVRSGRLVPSRPQRDGQGQFRARPQGILPRLRLVGLSGRGERRREAVSADRGRSRTHPARMGGGEHPAQNRRSAVDAAVGDDDREHPLTPAGAAVSATPRRHPRRRRSCGGPRRHQPVDRVARQRSTRPRVAGRRRRMVPGAMRPGFVGDQRRGDARPRDGRLLPRHDASRRQSGRRGGSSPSDVSADVPAPRRRRRPGRGSHRGTSSCSSASPSCAASADVTPAGRSAPRALGGGCLPRGRDRAS